MARNRDARSGAAVEVGPAGPGPAGRIWNRLGARGRVRNAETRQGGRRRTRAAVETAGSGAEGNVHRNRDRGLIFRHANPARRRSVCGKPVERERMERGAALVEPAPQLFRVRLETTEGADRHRGPSRLGAARRGSVLRARKSDPRRAAPSRDGPGIDDRALRGLQTHAKKLRRGFNENGPGAAIRSRSTGLRSRATTSQRFDGGDIIRGMGIAVHRLLGLDAPASTAASVPPRRPCRVSAFRTPPRGRAGESSRACPASSRPLSTAARTAHPGSPS